MADPAGFVPDEDEPTAPAGFVPDTQDEDKVAPGGLTGLITGQPAAPSRAEAVGRGAVQGATLGFGDELSAGIDALLSHVPGVRNVAERINKVGGEGAGLPLTDPNITYQQRRDSYRSANGAASQSHPGFYLGGELAGGLATAKPLGMFSGAAPSGAGVGTVMDRALLGGGIAGVGNSNADTVSGVVRDGLVGAGTGAATAGVLHGIGAGLAARAPKAFVKDLNAEVFSKAAPKESQPAIAFQKANPTEFHELAYSKDFAPVQEAVRAGKTDAAVTAASAFVDKAGANRLKNYQVIADSGYQTTPGPVVDRMEKLAASKSATSSPEEAKALKDAADRVRNEFSTVDTAQIKQGDTAEGAAMQKLAPFLPSRGTITKAEMQDAATKLAKQETGNPNANYGDVSNDVHQAIEGLPFSYNPQAPVSIVQLRKAATNAQDATHATLGSIAETEHFRIVQGVDQAINAGLNAHLDAAAKASPLAAQAVANIRHDNKIMSMAMSMQTALEQRLAKESSGKVLTTGQKFTRAATAAGALGGAVGAFAHNPALAAAAGASIPVAAAGVRRGSDLLARTLDAASKGNPWAIRTLATMRATPAGAARLASSAAPAVASPSPIEAQQ